MKFKQERKKNPQEKRNFEANAKKWQRDRITRSKTEHNLTI